MRKRRISNMKNAWLARALTTILCLVLVFSVVGVVQADDGGKWSNPYLVRTFVDEQGREIAEISVPGRPPEIKAPVASVPEPSPVMGTNSLSNVPAFNWCYGCSATSAAMMMGYYDNTGYSNMYAGPTNGGVCPMDNSVWGPGIVGSDGECPLSATHQGKDGRTIKGHVDDYWVDYADPGPDPFIGSWAEHTHGECTGDYMGTNQSLVGNVDGETLFYWYTDGDPLYDFTLYEPAQRDGCHGMRLFAESRGYTVNANFSQLIKGQGTDPNKGFTFADFKAEIDAGRPVLIQIAGHTMLGYGYNDPDTVYLHDTWDHDDHSMTWGGSYEAMQHEAVTVIQLESVGEPDITVSPPSFEVTLPPDADWSDTLDIGNVGGEALTYTISDVETTASMAFITRTYELTTAEELDASSGVKAGDELRCGVEPTGLIEGLDVLALGTSTTTYDDDEVARLNALGANAVLVEDAAIAALSLADLQLYDVVYLPLKWGESLSYIEAIGNTIKTYASNGGGLVVGQCGPASVPYTPGFLPYSLTYTSTWFPDCGVTILDSTHYITSGLTGDDMPDVYDRILTATLDGNYDLLAKSSWEDVLSLAVVEYGGGRIAVHTSNWMGVPTVCESDPDIIIERIFYWTAQGVAPVDCPWLDEDPKFGSVAPGDPADSITVSINATGLTPGDYSANIVIDNNDPDEDPKIVPVTLHVGAATTVVVDPASKSVSQGEQFTLDVLVTPGQAIACAQCNISFDSSLITADSVAEGDLLTQGGANTYFMSGTIDNTAGTISGSACAVITPGATVSGQGVFATITFTADAINGDTPITLSDVIVGDAGGDPVAVEVTNGSVTVSPGLIGDVNGDGHVNVLDLVLIGQHWGETGTPGWIPEDVKVDGVINVLDMVLIGQHWTG